MISLHTERRARTGAIMIFDERERTRTDAKKPGEDEFAFYDAIAGGAYEVYRATLNEWIAERFSARSIPR